MNIDTAMKVLATVLICIFAFALLVVTVHCLMPDPAQQVRDGIEAARVACHNGKAVTPEELKVCRMLR